MSLRAKCGICIGASLALLFGEVAREGLPRAQQSAGRPGVTHWAVGVVGCVGPDCGAKPDEPWPSLAGIPATGPGVRRASVARLLSESSSCCCCSNADLPGGPSDSWSIPAIYPSSDDEPQELDDPDERTKKAPTSSGIAGASLTIPLLGNVPPDRGGIAPLDHPLLTSRRLRC
jgi:hypothetical protein